MNEITSTEAANGFGALINRVLTGEEVLITRAGSPVARIVRQLERPVVEVHCQLCPVCGESTQIYLFGKPGATYADHLLLDGTGLCPSSGKPWPLQVKAVEPADVEMAFSEDVEQWDL